MLSTNSLYPSHLVALESPNISDSGPWHKQQLLRMAMAMATAPPRYSALPAAPSVAPPSASHAPLVRPSSTSRSASTGAAAPPLLRQRLSSSSLAAEKLPDSADAFAPSSADRSGDTDTPPMPTILQPRVAVVLNVPPPWHPWLFALRLCSILPALWWGLPSTLRLLLYFLPGPPDQFLLVRPSCVTNGDPLQGASCSGDRAEAATAVMLAPYAVTETALATIWVRIFFGIGGVREGV